MTSGGPRAISPVDLARLHRFLMEHQLCDEMGDCPTCGANVIRTKQHAPDCEWVALVEMTKGTRACVAFPRGQESRRVKYVIVPTLRHAEIWSRLKGLQPVEWRAILKVEHALGLPVDVDVVTTGPWWLSEDSAEAKRRLEYIMGRRIPHESLDLLCGVPSGERRE